MNIPDNVGTPHPANTIEQCDALLNGARILRAKLKAYSPRNPALGGVSAYIDRILERRSGLSVIANNELDKLFSGRARE